jgi:lysozyme
VALGLAILASLGLAGCGHRHLVARSAASQSTASAVAAAVGEAARSGPIAIVVPASARPATPVARVVPASARPAAPLARPRFGDAHPVAWPGRTPAAYPVHGIDVSRWQGRIDWPVARDHGVSFAFIKATEGADHSDPLFLDHWRAAGAAGVPRGAYHFYYFCRSAAEQAAWFIANVPREAGALPPVLDVEWNGESKTCPRRPSPQTVRSEMTTFLNLVGRHYDQTPIVYTTVDFWHDNQLWRVHGAQPWLRAVTRHPSEAYPDASWWAFWQYSGTGLVPGIGEEVDLNAFAGSQADWAIWLAANRL